MSALGLTTPYVKALAGRSRALVPSRTLPQHVVVSALREARGANATRVRRAKAKNALQQRTKSWEDLSWKCTVAAIRIA